MSGFRRRTRHSAAGDVPYPLEGLLQDMRDLRLTLAADLHAAAAATEDGATDVASDIVAADREEIARFRRVAEMRMSRLQRLAVAEPEAPRWRRRVAFTLPAIPLVGAMAVSAAAVTGVLPVPGSHSAHPQSQAAPASSSPVTASLQELQAVVDNNQASAHDVIVAARALHRQLAALIASDNPERNAEVAELLRMEQDMLLRAQPPGASVVLDATRRLAQQLVTTTSPLPQPGPTSTDLPKPLPTSSPKSKKSPSPSASPKASSSPKPSASSSADPSSSPDSGNIPAVP